MAKSPKRFSQLAITACLACTLLNAASAGESRVRFDFETGDMQGWRVVQGSFGKTIGSFDVFQNTPTVKYNKQGTYYLHTLQRADGSTTGELTGVIESPVFTLDGGAISLWVGGGAHGNTYVALCTADGKEVFTARGKNVETLQEFHWDASELVGRKVFVKMVDLHPGHWGYIAMDDFRALGRIDVEATRLRFKDVDRRLAEEARKRLLAEYEPLSRAITDLIETFGDAYPRGEEFLVRLDALCKLPHEQPGRSIKLETLRREALTANPLVAGQPIVFVVRQQYSNNHGTEATMCQTGEVNTEHFRGGGAMKMLDLAERGKVTTLIDLPKGIARDPEIDFDGRKILFSMRRDIADDYHLYEMNADGGEPVQLTHGPRISDIQPAYLPGGRIVFASTREPKYIPCQRHLMTNLFVANADGSNIRQIGHNTQFEGRPSVTPDGRILYTRWEYVDKHFASAYGLWTVNPDGTNHALYYGGYAWQPGAIADAAIIPGTERFVSIFTSVHNLAWGAMAVVDRSRGLDGMKPVLQSWPADISPWMSQWNTIGRIGGGVDSFKHVPIKYEDPYPLSEKYFLCSRSLAPGNHQMGIFLVDTFGNELLLHSESPGCFDPVPIVPRKRPPSVPSRVDLAAGEGTFYVQDVYIGEGMERVERGSVKYLRIVEAPAKQTFPPFGIGDWTPALSGDSHHPVAVNWDHYNNKRVLGTVPIEADGSAHFSVPSGKFVYFQLLDSKRMMIQSMRSGTTVQPGETMGCIGCHDYRLATPPLPRRDVALALRRPASAMEPWYGPARNFSYTAEVQPVLDKHCVRCHDYGKEAEELNLSGDSGIAFNMSYCGLRSQSPAVWEPSQADGAKPLISAVGAGPIRVIPPYSWGSHRSRLVDLLRKGHEDVELDAESLERIITWIDLNTPYYPSHVTYYGNNTFGRCPLDHGQLSRLGALLIAQPGNKTFRWAGVKSYSGTGLSRLVMTGLSPINFTRPERSACLAVFPNAEDPGYVESLSIIRAGEAMVAQHPRLDMPGFQPSEMDRQRLEYLAQQRRRESDRRAAIVRGEKVFDVSVP